MLGFFVTPFPNETFYSLVGRFIRRFSPVGFGIRCLFGKNFVTIKNELAADLDFFLCACNKIFAKTASQIYDQHTIWPLYKLFIDTKTTEKLDGIISNGGRHINHELTLRFRHSSLTPLYCPVCNQNQIENSKELYWNRLHQIPNILICPDHLCYLEKAEAIDDGQLSSGYIFIANNKSCPITAPRFCDNDFIIDVSNVLKNWLSTPSHLTLDYRSRMNDLGYNKGSRLDFRKLEIDFTNIVGKSTIEQYGSYSKGIKALPKSLIYSYKTFNNPANHAILVTFFRKKSDSTKTQKEFLPFGKGPWKCINKTCPFFKKTVIQIHRCNYIKKTNKHTGYFRCTCGLEYTRSATHNGIPGKIKISEYGERWKNVARELLRHGNTVREIARRIGHTVQSGEQAIRKMLTMKVDVKAKKTKSAISKAKLKEMRRAWRKAVKANIKSCNLTVIRSNHDLLYNCLIKHDGPWINSFNIKYRSKTKNRVPTKQKANLEKILFDKIKELKTKFPALKITKKRLSIVLGTQLTKKDISQSKLDKLLNSLEKSILIKNAA